MSFLPKSRKARRRLMAVAVAAPILAASAALVLYALGDSVSFFYSPARRRAAHVPAGRTIELGGLVPVRQRATRRPTAASLHGRRPARRYPVVYRGELPDLFREGQGVVAKGAFRAGRRVPGHARSSPSTTSATCRASWSRR